MYKGYVFEEKGTTEDEMAGWHHWLDGCESQWTPEVGDGQGGLACCDSWGRKESDTTEPLIWSDLIFPNVLDPLVFPFLLATIHITLHVKNWVVDMFLSCWFADVCVHKGRYYPLCWALTIFSLEYCYFYTWLTIIIVIIIIFYHMEDVCKSIYHLFSFNGLLLLLLLSRFSRVRLCATP